MMTDTTILQKAIAYHQNGKLDKAESLYRRIVKQDKDNADAWHLLGVVFYQMGELDIAENNILNAIRLNPNVASFYSNIGLVYHQKKAYDKATASYRKALTLVPDYPEALNNLGNSLKETGLKNSAEHREALTCYQQALALAPNYADALNNLATLLVLNDQADEALHYYQQAIRANPNYADAYSNLGLIHKNKGEFDKAAEYLKKALGFPGLSNPQIFSSLYEIKRETCDWEGIDSLQAELLEKALNPKSTTLIDPFTVISKLTDVSQEAQYRLIQKYCDHKIPQTNGQKCFTHEKKAKERIHIGYVSADFFDHATMHLIAGLFPHHNRKHFEVSLFSLYHENDSAYYKKAVEGADRMIDLSGLSDEAAAEKIYNSGIDILIDLNGWTRNARAGILAYRPAPVQIQYLGYPGTMACDFIDYMITDKIVTPPQDEAYYSEKFLYMPECYQVNDATHSIRVKMQTRHECGLPEETFVFCSFNHPYKIEPKIFGIWMEILKQKDDSVLWLYESNTKAVRNLKKEAQKHGVDPERLIFAKKLPKSSHLARMRHADLFLDTYYYNAHTTASDALYAGVPLITCPGERFASRVAASLLHALGLEECITSSLDAYKELALQLADDKQMLKQIRMKLNENKKTASLFKTEQFAKSLERGLTLVWDTHQKNKKIEMISIKKEELS